MKKHAGWKLGLGRENAYAARENAYAVLWRVASGEPLRKLAKEYGVTYAAIRLIVLRKNYRSLSASHD